MTEIRNITLTAGFWYKSTLLSKVSYVKIYIYMRIPQFERKIHNIGCWKLTQIMQVLL